jgi:ABC-type Fe3+ transport system permease subunit/DNA-binding beta-propeller fold protein YncE
MNWVLLKNSLLVGGAVTLLAVSSGFLAALWAAALSRRWQSGLLTASVLALALPPFLVTNCWLHFLGANGAWRPFIPFNIFSLGGTIWILTLLTWPLTLVLVRSAWYRLQPADLESEPALRGRHLVRHLLLPAARGALWQAALLTFVLAIGNFAVPAILQTRVLPAEAWVRFNTAFDTSGALRLSMPLVIAAAGLLLWLGRTEVQWPRFQGAATASLFRRRLGRAWLYACGLFTTALSLLSLLPLFQIASVKRTWTELPGALAAGGRQLWNSFFFAAAAATAIIAVGLAAGARGLGSRAGRTFAQRLASALLWLPFFVPGVVIGIALITAFNRPFSAWLYQSAGIVILAFGIRYLGLGWNSTGHALRTLDSDLTDAARLDGATAWQLIRRVHWPEIAPQIAAAWYIIFLLCLWDVESMILVYPPGGETLALRVFNLLHYGDNAQVNALCLTLLALAAAPMVCWRIWGVVRNPGLKAMAGVLGGLCLLLALLPGCGPAPAANEVPIDSRVFSRVRVIGSRGVGIGEFNKPRSVAVDARDNLYVVDMTGRVQKFSPDGVFGLSWQMPQTDLGKPKGMCRDREGNIVVLEPHYQRVNHFSPDARLVAQWGASGTGSGQFKLPRAVAVNSRGEIFVSEYSGVERVQRFRLRRTGGEGPAQVEFLDSIGRAGTGPGEFNRPEGLCVDAQDRLYVADSCNHRIQVFSSEGEFLASYGKAGSGKGELSYPYDICVDQEGRQYVCEFGNSRIQVFDRNHESIEIIGGAGPAPGQFNNPWGVALDSRGNLYVADSQNHRVQKLLRAEHSSLPRQPATGGSLYAPNGGEVRAIRLLTSAATVAADNVADDVRRRTDPEIDQRDHRLR